MNISAIAVSTLRQDRWSKKLLTSRCRMNWKDNDSLAYLTIQRNTAKVSQDLCSFLEALGGTKTRVEGF